jgi:ABC-2 type transport system ATP-binding protein
VHVIEVHGLTKRYGRTVAVDDLSFAVQPGRVTGFLGPNGAGKSTTMRMILGLDRPQHGTTTVRGRPYTGYGRPLREVGALLDAKALHGGRSAYNHLLCLAQSNGIGRRRVDEVLDIAGIGAVRNRRAGKFSLGMGQRLGIAAALLGDPPVLMFDEPVNGLDPEGIRWIRTLLRGLAAQGRTVFVSSHLMSEMALTADHLVVIGRGRLIADVSMREMVEGAGRPTLVVRSPRAADLTRLLVGAGGEVEPLEPDEDAPSDLAPGIRVSALDAATVGDLAAAHGVPIYELTPHQISLEAAYMDLTGDSVDYRGTPSTVGPDSTHGATPDATFDGTEAAA